MKPLTDYSHIRGFCHHVDTDDVRLRRELGYAKKLDLNSTRVWLSFEKYEEDPKGYVEGLIRFVRTCWEMGVSVMPILFNGNMLKEFTLEKEFYPRGEVYAAAVVEALKDEPGLIMWDVMNEPSCNDFIHKSPREERPARLEKLWDFCRHFCEFVRSLDPVNAITLGHTVPMDVEPTADCVDVLSFHDYKGTRARVEESYKAMEALSEKTRKPILNTELCCLCRANPYDMALEKAREHHTGWYLFNLMIGDGVWGCVHGIFYPDGTVRDPSVPAAVLGIYRNRDPETHKAAQPNQEGHAERAIEEALTVLQLDRTDAFKAHSHSVEEILEAAEYCANTLECCELVPMNEPPTLQINRFRAQKNPSLDEVKAFCYKLVQQLRQAAML